MPERERPAPGGGGDVKDKEETRSKLFVNSIRAGSGEGGSIKVQGKSFGWRRDNGNGVSGVLYTRSDKSVLRENSEGGSDVLLLLDR